jgi:hypothetical protein
MNASARRLKKLEDRMYVVPQVDVATLRVKIAYARRFFNPDMRLVGPEDTDPETYRDIRETVLLYDGNIREYLAGRPKPQRQVRSLWPKLKSKHRADEPYKPCPIYRKKMHDAFVAAGEAPKKLADAIASAKARRAAAAAVPGLAVTPRGGRGASGPEQAGGGPKGNVTNVTMVTRRSAETVDLPAFQPGGGPPPR